MGSFITSNKTTENFHYPESHMNTKRKVTHKNQKVTSILRGNGVEACTIKISSPKKLILKNVPYLSAIFVISRLVINMPTTYVTNINKTKKKNFFKKYIYLEFHQNPSNF